MMMAACLLTFFCLVFAASMYFRQRAGSVELVRRTEARHSYSDLEQDQKILAADMRQLRRDLRHRAGEMIISVERDTIRQDWLDIVIDRGLSRDSLAPALVDAARAAHSRWRWADPGQN